MDGVDCVTNEKKHPVYNIDTKACSHKSKHCAVKYKLAVSVHHAQCCSINGPHIGGVHDLTMFWKGKLSKKMKYLSTMGKKAIVDGGYKGQSTVNEQHFFSFPDRMDSKKLHAFKTCARLQHETFNRRIKMFGALQNKFRHDYDMHIFVFEAVTVIVQYQMDNGSPIFSM